MSDTSNTPKSPAATVAAAAELSPALARLEKLHDAYKSDMRDAAANLREAQGGYNLACARVETIERALDEVKREEERERALVATEKARRRVPTKPGEIPLVAFVKEAP